MKDTLKQPPGECPPSATEWHPLRLGHALKHAIERDGLTMRDAALALDIRAPRLESILTLSAPISPDVAVRLYQFGIDGRLFYMGQETRAFDLALWRARGGK